LGFKEDYDVDEKEEILDIVSNMKKYIKKLQGQKTLFGEDEEIEKLIFDG